MFRLNSAARLTTCTMHKLSGASQGRDAAFLAVSALTQTATVLSELRKGFNGPTVAT